MATVYDVQATKLIELVREDLKKITAFKQPEWALFVKTGSHKERQPIQDDWWFSRGASILRRIYVDGPKGVSRLRSYYGGRKARGVKPHRFAKGAGKILRVWM
ncbi:40S ribosomal protein S19, partial [archaeon]|nr:40S ribosomal protein S19 [archaeon]